MENTNLKICKLCNQNTIPENEVLCEICHEKNQRKQKKAFGGYTTLEDFYRGESSIMVKRLEGLKQRIEETCPNVEFYVTKGVESKGYLAYKGVNSRNFVIVEMNTDNLRVNIPFAFKEPVSSDGLKNFSIRESDGTIAFTVVKNADFDRAMDIITLAYNTVTA